jgi:hypothetical protein
MRAAARRLYASRLRSGKQVPCACVSSPGSRSGRTRSSMESHSHWCRDLHAVFAIDHEWRFRVHAHLSSLKIGERKIITFGFRDVRINGSRFDFRCARVRTPAIARVGLLMPGDGCRQPARYLSTSALPTRSLIEDRQPRMQRHCVHSKRIPVVASHHTQSRNLNRGWVSFVSRSRCLNTSKHKYSISTSSALAEGPCQSRAVPADGRLTLPPR